MAQVAHDRMSEEEIVSNILAAASQVAEKLDGGRANIRNLHIKCSSTTSVPVYMNFGDPGKVEMPEYKQKLYDVAVDDVTTVEEGHVYVRADGLVNVVKRKAKQEDAVKQETEDDGDGEDDDFDDKIKSPRKKKKLDIKQEVADNDGNPSRKKKRKVVDKEEMDEQDDDSDGDNKDDAGDDLDNKKDGKPVKNKKKKDKKETSSKDNKVELDAVIEKKSRKGSKKRYFESKMKTNGAKSKSH